MKTTISFEVDSPAKAREIIAAVERACNVPYKQDGFGVRTLDADPEATADKPNTGGTGTAGEQSGSDDGAADAPRPNVNPGEPSIGKIGTATKDLILADLAKGRQLPQPKYTEHLKLLWKRKEVMFDGVNYYLPG